MTRARWLLVLLVLAAIGVGVGVLLAPGDDGASSDDGDGLTAATTTVVAGPTTTGPTASSTSTTAPPVTTIAAVPGACGATGAAIRTATEAGVAGAATAADITECRLAASDTSWALVQLTPKAGSSFTATTVVLRNTGGAWNVVATGGANAGCGKAPQQVIVDLGQFCVGAGGGGQ